jgi:hypothetical protein
MLFAEGEMLLAKSEEDLKYFVHNLNNMAVEFSTERNTGEKTKIMSFRLRNQSGARYALKIGY